MNKLTFSILLVGLFAAAVLARTSPQIRRPFTFTPGQTYIYEYRGRQWNGLTKLADQYTGLTVDCDVILKAQSNGQEVLMKLDDVKVEQLHTQAIDNNDIRKLNPGQEINARQMTLFKDELSKPIRFTYVDGKVLRFVAEASDAEWSINIKKSILSLFQLDLAPSKIIKSQSKQQIEAITGTQAIDMIRDTQDMPLVYPIYEESFGGICETLYEVDSIDNVEKRGQQEFVQFADVLNVTKTVNYKNCLTDPSVSYDHHSFKVNTQTVKGKLFSQEQQTVAGTQFYPIPEELKSKYANVYNSIGQQDNVASPVPVERQSFTKYNISTSPKTLANRRSTILATQDDMSLIEGIYSEGKIKYETESDLLVSATQQSLTLVACAPTSEMARIVPEYSALQIVAVNQPSVDYQTIQCELNTQKVKFYQAMWKFNQMQSAYKTGQSPLGASSPLYSNKLALPFALSASWYPLVATGTLSPEQSVDNLVNPDQLAKAYENLLIGLAEDVLTEDVAQSKKAGEKVVRLTNIVAFMPKQKLVEIYERIVERIQQAKQQQAASRGQQAIVDNSEVAKWKIVRKLCLDSLPLAGSKQAIEMIEMLIQYNRVKPFEAKELCEAVPANLRYPDTEIIDAFIRISQLPQVRKNRSLFASCSIAVGKMVSQAYAKSKDASYKPTTYEQYNKLPTNLRNDDIIKQVIDEADPRRQMPINWDSSEQQELYERLVLDEQDLIKYVKLYKQMLNKATTYHDKVIYLETLAHMKVPHVLPILEPFVTGRLSLAQCLGSQPMDTDRPLEPSQWYNRQKRMTAIKRQQGLDAADITFSQQQQQTDKDWNEQEAYGAEECNYMRTIAIYALAHVARWSPSKVQALLLPVFDNTYEPYQIRIAAFTTMTITKIDEHVLERIASQMWREPNKEVASFVVGTIDTMSKLTSPAAGPYKYAAQKAASAMPKQYLDTFKFSWMAGGDHFNHQKQTGMSWLAEIVKSNVSTIPRAAYFHIGRQHGPGGIKHDNQLELGFTSKGLESLIKQYIEFNKQQTDETNIVASILETLYDAKDDIVKYYFEARDQIKASLLNDQKETTTSEPFVQNFNFKRQQPIDGVNSRQGKQSRQVSDLFEGVNSRSKRSVTIQARSSQDDDEEAKLTLFAKMFDETSYHALDKKQIIDLFEKFDDYVKMAADQLIKGGKLHYVKMMMPSNMWHMVPSQIGMPIVVTHRRPIVASIKIDGAANGQLTSTKVSQFVRQQATGQQVPNVIGHNFATAEGLNITAIVHPKIMHSNFNFMFAVEQSNNEAYGVTTEKSHALSLPLEVSVAFSSPKQLVSFAIEPKTPNRMLWTKEVAKTFIGKLSIAGPTPDNWLGKEHLVRVPSQQAQYKRLERASHYVPSLLTSIQDLINEPKEQQKKAIEELETPYKFEHRFVQDILGLEINMDGASDDENIVRGLNKPDMSKSTRGQLQWTSTDEIDDLNQHTKCGPLSEQLHLIESANSRSSKYLEFYATIKPDQPHKSPIYRFDIVLDGKNSPSFKLNQLAQQRQQDAIRQVGIKSRPINRLDMQSTKMWEAIEQNKKMNQISQQQNMLEAY